MPAATPSGTTIVALPVPADLDAPDAWLLHGMVDCANRTWLDTWGELDEPRRPAEVLAGLRDQEYQLRLRYVALDVPAERGPADPGRVLGHLSMVLPRHDNTGLAYLHIDVRPEHRGRGIGTALHALALDTARSHGRTTLVTASFHAAEPEPGPDALAPPTGFGRVDAADPTVRHLRNRGWHLEQVARRSMLDVPLRPAVLAAHRERATEAAGPDYRVLTWVTHCPDELVDRFACLQSRMSTDAPQGGMDRDEEAWDAARVRAGEAHHVGRDETYRVAAAQHVPTGDLVAFTALVSQRGAPLVQQDDTLVLREHRGHRLGMLVKATNLGELAAAAPAARRIATWNAQENAPMLAINAELGFRPAGGSGEWQLRLT
ncbi:MAG TPA: GNAT family N-acetyltransferase [Cellulomonas sp.]